MQQQTVQLHRGSITDSDVMYVSSIVSLTLHFSHDFEWL